MGRRVERRGGERKRREERGGKARPKLVLTYLPSFSRYRAFKLICSPGLTVVYLHFWELKFPDHQTLPKDHTS